MGKNSVFCIYIAKSNNWNLLSIKFYWNSCDLIFLCFVAAVERAGGTVRTAYYDLDSLRAAVNPGSAANNNFNNEICSIETKSRRINEREV